MWHRQSKCCQFVHNNALLRDRPTAAMTIHSLFMCRVCEWVELPLLRMHAWSSDDRCYFQPIQVLCWKPLPMLHVQMLQQDRMRAYISISLQSSLVRWFSTSKLAASLPGVTDTHAYKQNFYTTYIQGWLPTVQAATLTKFTTLPTSKLNTADWLPLHISVRPVTKAYSGV